MAKIMIQGTGSSVGKSIIVTALCRIFKQDGYKVCPYKSQNMSLNSYITLDGKEMGRAQVLQAYAAGLEPEAFMNPILLKPTGERKCQVIVNGKVYGNSSAVEYHKLKPTFANMLKEQFNELEQEFDIIVIEGAGSPAEINLRENDIVNMGMAELVDAPVIIVGDIDKGGVFASLAGTMLLISESEKERVKGVVINKFRGDIELLKPGIKMLDDIIHRDTLGVVPYFKLELEDEDGAVELNKAVNNLIDVAVIKLPHISNFTDADALKMEDDVSVRYISKLSEFGSPNLLIIPGSKNTIQDLLYLKESGLYEKIIESANKCIILGICGGFQMLGKKLKDPHNVESGLESYGLGLLDINTTFYEEKVTTRVNGLIDELNIPVYGYEIHMGASEYLENAKPLITINSQNDKDVIVKDGAINNSGTIMGTYIHGILDGVHFREYLINRLRTNLNLPHKYSKNYESQRELELDKLADLVREHLDMDKIYKILKDDGL